MNKDTIRIQFRNDGDLETFKKHAQISESMRRNSQSRNGKIVVELPFPEEERERKSLVRKILVGMAASSTTVVGPTCTGCSDPMVEAEFSEYGHCWICVNLSETRTSACHTFGKTKSSGIVLQVKNLPFITRKDLRQYAEIPVQGTASDYALRLLREPAKKSTWTPQGDTLEKDRKVISDALSFLSGLNLQDHSLAEQRKQREIVHSLMQLLEPDKNINV